MASRRDYERTAAIIRQEVTIVQNESPHSAVILPTLRNVAEGFSLAFSLDNPRFNRTRFFRACGFTEGEK
jgi:hypothetical protein